MSTYWSVDLGATSGRVMSVHVEGDRVRLQEQSRFANTPRARDGGLFWEVADLWESTVAGLQRAAEHAKAAGATTASVGVDSWGVDFGLVDPTGALVSGVRHYRSASTAAMTRTTAHVAARELFGRSGVTPMEINTVFRLSDAVREVPHGVDVTMLLVPDLWTFLLSGARAAELTIAGTTGLLDIAAQQWDGDLLDRLGIDRRMLPALAAPGSPAGPLLPALADRLGPGLEVTVRHSAGHDTAAAVAAIPVRARSAFVSCGTWALVGVETDRPVLTDEAYRRGFTNEIAAHGKFLLMRNLTGLWLLEQVLGSWRAADPSVSLSGLVARAADLDDVTSVVDVGAPALVHSPDVPEEIRRMCRATGQRAPETGPEMVRCIMLSLAVAFRAALDDCERLTGTSIDEVHMVGGGTRNALLCQLVADTCGRPVLVGPAEATSLGNALVQAMASGEVASPDEARQIVRAAFPPVHYEPRRGAALRGSDGHSVLGDRDETGSRA